MCYSFFVLLKLQVDLLLLCCSALLLQSRKTCIKSSFTIFVKQSNTVSFSISGIKPTPSVSDPAEVLSVIDSCCTSVMMGYNCTAVSLSQLFLQEPWSGSGKVCIWR